MKESKKKKEKERKERRRRRRREKNGRVSWLDFGFTGRRLTRRGDERVR